MALEDLTPAPRAPRQTELQLSLRQIEILHTVLSTRSITGAARLLKVSQPSVSRTIHRIEDVLKLTLFKRDGKRLVPSREALRVFEEIDAIMGQLSGLGHQIARIASGDEGTFRLGATASMARALVPQALYRLSQRVPGLDLFFDVLSVDQMNDYLVSGTGDCLVTIAPIDHPWVESEKLGDGHLVALLRQDHPLADRGHLAREDLRGLEVISFQSDGPHQRAIRPYLEGMGEVRKPRVTVRFTDTAIALASQGMGVALVDSFSAMGPLGADMRVLTLEHAPRFSVYLQWNRVRPSSQHLARLAAELRQLLADHP